jgi:uracil-DNA glycosylase family 4
MVVGNYFASCATYEKVRTGELPGLKRTWGRLGRLLAATSPTEVFLTNAFIGLAKGDTAPFPTNRDYTDRCAKFLEQEIQLFMPRAVVCMGGQAVRMLARVLPRELSAWRRGSLRELAETGGRVVEGCSVKASRFVAVAVYHPSSRVSNEARDIDAELVRRAIATA